MRFNETDFVTPGRMDFVPRERRNQIWGMVVVSILVIAVVFVLTFTHNNSLGGRTISAFVSMVAVAVLCFYMIYRKQQNLDLVMATEYQNMLFAEAVSLGSNFCLFVRRDGTIVYANSGLKQVFPDFSYNEAQALEGVFEEGGVPKADRDRVMGAIYSSSSARLVFPVRQNGEEKDYVLTVEPLTRPGGYVLIRGREYRGQRAGLQLLPDILRTTSADKLDHLLASSPVGLYVTDAFGRLEYINPAVEQLLGYHPVELLDARIAIHRLFYQLDGLPVPDDYTLADFNGRAQMQKHNGTLLTVTLQQTVIRETGGKVLGASGSILPIGA